VPSDNIDSHRLTSNDFAKIRLLGSKRLYNKGDLIFSDGDNADYIYFIETGNVSIFIEKFTDQVEISALGPGEYFGEMAFFSGDKRSASAAALIDTALLRVDKAAFLNLFEADRDIADKINQNFLKRNKELSFKEHLTGGNSAPHGESFQIGIKGDPSLRFSAFSRERYDSVVDRIISDLQPRLYDLLINRSAYEIFIHCNSGEVHIRTVFDPFNDDIHPASKLLNIAYIERHFPAIGYEKKSAMLKHLYGFISNDANFSRLPDQFKESQQSLFTTWEPVGQREIANTISKLSRLRKIPDFYLRNFSISIVSDAIRMQFNCDGTQIVNAQGFQAFLDQNLTDDDESIAPSHEQRTEQRRSHFQQASRSPRQYGERRSPPGRREEDWTAITGQD
jgi:CRP-like cAMP-binding protein